MEIMLPTIRISEQLRLPDTDQWQLRFSIQSETSDRLYIIAQHKHKRHWGCSCPGWKRNRHCKHLEALGIPADLTPYEVNLLNI